MSEASSSIRSELFQLDGESHADFVRRINDLRHAGVEDATRKPVARPLSELERFKGNDPAELLRNRFLCCQGGLLICGPTGIGKSALAMQCAIMWALGLSIFGIPPTRPLRSLFVQAENDDGDLAEMRDGVIRGLKLTDTQAKQACAAVHVIREDERTGQKFFDEVIRPLLVEHGPDLLWIDPALSYLGGDMNSQKDVGGFLRNGLNPLLREFNCACVVVHHTNKPSFGREKPDWQGNDFAYLGAGSAEWANWARAVLALRSVQSRTIFQLQAGKRGTRLGWKDKDGQKVFFKYLAHAKEPGIICWSEAEPDEVEESEAKTGRPKTYDESDLLSLLPSTGLTSTEWRARAEKKLRVTRSHFFRLTKCLKTDGRIIKTSDGKQWKAASND